MNGRWRSAGFLAVVLAVTVAAALWGCRGTREPAEGRTQEVTRALVRTTPELGLPPMIDSILAPTHRGVVQAYIDSLEFVDEDDPSTFPAWEEQLVHACGLGCNAPLASLIIKPEVGAMNLHPGDFTGKVRIIAIAKLDVVAPDTGTDELDEIGLTPQNTEKHSFLLTIGDQQAWFIWKDGTAFKAASTQPRHFSASTDGHVLNHSMARWFRKSHSSHLNGTWVACAEGCCTSFAAG